VLQILNTAPASRAFLFAETPSVKWALAGLGFGGERGHTHQMLIDGAECAMPHGAGWYVFAVECGTPRELNDVEEGAVNKFRFSASRKKSWRGNDNDAP
jgi:hypothetical protein